MKRLIVAFKFIIQNRELAAEMIDFVQTTVVAVQDRKISLSEKAALTEKFWNIVFAAQKLR